MPSEPIAIIGANCIFPGAKNLYEFWENLLTYRREFRLIPKERCYLDDYWRKFEVLDNYKFYQPLHCFIEGFNFDWLKYRIPKTTYEQADINHWLALQTTIQALEHSGLDLASLPKENAAVYIGNSTGEQTRDFSLKFKVPFLSQILTRSLQELNLNAEEVDSIIKQYSNNLKIALGKVTEDTSPGVISSVISGRIANFFDLKGGAITIDGACASSIQAIALAVRQLRNKDIDLAIAGGVDVAIDSFELSCFSAVKAQTQSVMSPFDANADGFNSGEGAGIVILKRLEDALKDGNKIYAVIKGVGLSTDGKGGILQPKPESQSLAIQRALTDANLSIFDLNFIEAHGTGTKVGDRVETTAIVNCLNKASARPAYSEPVQITSVKSQIGHLKTAAGAAGLIKTMLCLNQRTIPGTVGIKIPNQLFTENSKLITANIQHRFCESEKLLTAGVSAFGFGGHNSHVILSSFGPPCTKLQEKTKLLSKFKPQACHFLYFSSDSLEELRSKLKHAEHETMRMSFSELSDYTAYLIRGNSNNQKYQFVHATQSPLEASNVISEFLQSLSSFSNEKKLLYDLDAQVFLRRSDTAEDTFLISGVTPDELVTLPEEFKTVVANFLQNQSLNTLKFDLSALDLNKKVQIAMSLCFFNKNRQNFLVKNNRSYREQDDLKFFVSVTQRDHLNRNTQINAKDILGSKAVKLKLVSI